MGNVLSHRSCDKNSKSNTVLSMHQREFVEYQTAYEKNLVCSALNRTANVAIARKGDSLPHLTEQEINCRQIIYSHILGE